MENQKYYFFFALTIYFAILIYSIINTKSQVGNKSYSRGSGSYKAFFIAVIMAITMVGPADALALSQKGLTYGMLWAIFPIGAALAQYVTGTFFASRIKNTFPEIETIGEIYKSKCSKSSISVVGFIAFIQSIAFSGVLILAGGQILETFLEISKPVGMLITALFVGGYTSFRGMVAVMKTDKVQGFMMGSMILLLIIASITLTYSLGVNSLDQLIKKDTFDVDYSLSVIAGTFLAYFLGELLLPTYVIRASISENESAASKGFKWTSLILVIWYLLITYTGSLGELIPVGDRAAGDDLIILDVVKSFVGDNPILFNVLGALVFLVFLSLIHSTFDSFLNNGAVSFSKDILSNFLELNNKQEVWIAKQATIGISVLGLVIAIWKNDLIDILFLGYTIWVPTVLASLIWILLNKNERLQNNSFWTGIVVGLIVWFILDNVLVTFIPALLAGLLANYLTIITIQKKKKSVEH